MAAVIGNSTPMGMAPKQTQAERREVQYIIHDEVSKMVDKHGRPLEASIHAPAHLREKEAEAYRLRMAARSASSSGHQTVEPVVESVPTPASASSSGRQPVKAVVRLPPSLGKPVKPESVSASASAGRSLEANTHVPARTGHYVVSTPASDCRPLRASKYPPSPAHQRKPVSSPKTASASAGHSPEVSARAPGRLEKPAKPEPASAGRSLEASIHAPASLGKPAKPESSATVDRSLETSIHAPVRLEKPAKPESASATVGRSLETSIHAPVRLEKPAKPKSASATVDRSLKASINAASRLEKPVKPESASATVSRSLEASLRALVCPRQQEDEASRKIPRNETAETDGNEEYLSDAASSTETETSSTWSGVTKSLTNMTFEIDHEVAEFTPEPTKEIDYDAQLSVATETLSTGAPGTNPTAPEFTPESTHNVDELPTSPAKRGIRSPGEFMESFKAIRAKGSNNSGQKIAPRRISFKNVPDWANFTDILCLTHGGAVDRIFTGAEGEFIVQFCDPESCERYAGTYASGIRVEDNHVIDVSKAPSSDRITPALESLISSDASRVVRLGKVPSGKSFEDMHDLATGFDVEHIMYNARFGCEGSVYFFFCGIVHGHEFLQKLQAEKPWPDLEVAFVPDPCKVAQSFHGNSAPYQMATAVSA